MPVTDTLLIDRVINTAVLRRASDLHFIIGSYPILRIAGQLIQLTDEHLVDGQFMTALLAYFFGVDFLKSINEKNEAEVLFSHGDQSHLRVQAYKQKGDWAITVKRINDRLPLLETYSYGNIIKPLLSGFGLIVITGPYNSGKSTTCGSLLQHINANYNKRIVTIEDAIERLYINDKAIIEQRQVGRDVDTISDGLKQLADQDIEVVVISKIETASDLEQMLRLVSANKLVIVGAEFLSASNCLLSWQSLLPMEQHEWFNQTIGDFLRLIISQEFVPGIMTGDQVMVAEVLLVTDNISQTLAAGKLSQIDGLLNSSHLPSLVSFDNALIDAVNRGLVEPTAAVNVAHDRLYVQTRVGGRYRA